MTAVQGLQYSVYGVPLVSNVLPTSSSCSFGRDGNVIVVMRIFFSFLFTYSFKHEWIALLFARPEGCCMITKTISHIFIIIHNLMLASSHSAFVNIISTCAHKIDSLMWHSFRTALKRNVCINAMYYLYQFNVLLCKRLVREGAFISRVKFRCTCQYAACAWSGIPDVHDSFS